MKKAILFILFATSASVFAQTDTTKVSPQFTTQAQAVNLDLNFLGVQYNREIPIAPKSTINLHGGVAFEFGYLYSGITFNDNSMKLKNNWVYDTRLILGGEFRYYYNIERRLLKGKNIRRNTANFLALDLLYSPQAFIEHQTDTHGILLLSPYWGLRRVYKHHWLIELNTGLNFGHTQDHLFLTFKLNFRLGYSF